MTEVWTRLQPFSYNRDFFSTAEVPKDFMQWCKVHELVFTKYLQYIYEYLEALVV